ncbi:hypothetical protein SmJEL517_g02850 [Synchytrium microbalum]|uniref:Uncharacterized protein n=1 Tax=Synchytrium microbalum TaxID=1806994 RepID=A0A507C9E2_9FUNG|nr:uncharacterized protein SmJEL517_g02850 [Synchytrium microbalum]TPX34584.1 hypothetical protein SmJEL517_g02850 [Synchytrium microbalum]
MTVDNDILYSTTEQPMNAFVGSAAPERANTIQLKTASSYTEPARMLDDYKTDTMRDTQKLANAIVPSLIDIWIEAAPDVFTGVSVNFSPALTTLSKVLDILDLLSQYINKQQQKEITDTFSTSKLLMEISAWYTKMLSLLTKHVGPYFPFIAHYSGNMKTHSGNFIRLVNMDTKFVSVASTLCFSVASPAEELLVWRAKAIQHLTFVLASDNRGKVQDNQIQAVYAIGQSLWKHLNPSESLQLVQAVVDDNTESAIESSRFSSSLSFLADSVTELAKVFGKGGGFIFSSYEPMEAFLVAYVKSLNKRFSELEKCPFGVLSSVLKIWNCISVISKPPQNPPNYFQWFQLRDELLADIYDSLRPFFSQTDAATGKIRFGPFIKQWSTDQNSLLQFLITTSKMLPLPLQQAIADCLRQPCIAVSTVGSYLTAFQRNGLLGGWLILKRQDYINLVVSVLLVGYSKTELDALQTKDVKTSRFGGCTATPSQPRLVEKDPSRYIGFETTKDISLPADALGFPRGPGSKEVVDYILKNTQDGHKLHGCKLELCVAEKVCVYARRSELVSRGLSDLAISDVVLDHLSPVITRILTGTFPVDLFFSIALVVGKLLPVGAWENWEGTEILVQLVAKAAVAAAVVSVTEDSAEVCIDYFAIVNHDLEFVVKGVSGVAAVSPMFRAAFMKNVQEYLNQRKLSKHIAEGLVKIVRDVFLQPLFRVLLLHDEASFVALTDIVQRPITTTA